MIDETNRHESQEPLLDIHHNIPQYQPLTFYQKLRYEFSSQKTNQKRRIIKPFQGYSPRGIFSQNNKTDNTKFTWYTFIFIFLYIEFSNFSNIYYLLLTLSQFIDAFSVGFKISYILPLAIILLFRAFEEIYQHIRIARRDKKTNSKKYMKIQKKDNELKRIEVEAMDLRIGDVVEIQNERVPADIVILASNVYIRTDQIDGETDLKVRKPLPKTDKIYNENPDKIFPSDCEVETDTREFSLHEFNAKITYFASNRADPITLENTVWSGCSISHNQIIGLVIATGEETRLEKNSKSSKMIKSTNLDYKVNIFNIELFVIMFILSFLNALASGTMAFGFKQFSISLVRFIVILSFLIPMSLKMFLMIGRFGFSQNIMRDQEIEGTIVKTETIVDELGKIEVILSDKTGTITQNEMYMDKIAYGDKIVDKNQFKDNLHGKSNQKKQLANQFNSQMNIGQDQSESDSNIKTTISDTNVLKSNSNQNNLEFKIAKSLVLCNNVRMDLENDKRVFNASSPDEIAMVEYFEELNFEITERNEHRIKFKDKLGNEWHFSIVKIFPFESARKRMGIVVRNEGGSDQLEFYIKGADDVMKEKVHDQDAKVFIDEKTYELASEGLRTLCFGRKNITQEEFEEFEKNFNQNLLEGNAQENENLIRNLESNIDFLAITAVKDLLQENVNQSVVYTEQAKLKLWILTGDKVETAAHICKSTGLVKSQRDLKIITGITQRELQHVINTSSYIKDEVLLIDGCTLNKGLQLGEEYFLEYCLQFKFVCFARCSPSQKFEIAQILKEKLNKTILAVGDGGNDVGMIQIANVGVGIQGKEGNQAAGAADFTILKFSYLCKLIFFHGRNSHRGLSSITQFLFHRGIIISWLQEIFTACFFMISMPIFNGFLVATYSAVFTILPVFSVIFDVDISWEKLQFYLESYKASGRGVSFQNFMIWNFISLYQAIAIFGMSFIVFDNYFSNFVGITFTALILAETFNIMIFVPRFSSWMLASIITTFVVYFICIIIFPEQMNIDIFDFSFFVKCFYVFLVCWLPVFIVERIIKYSKVDVTDLN